MFLSLLIWGFAVGQIRLMRAWEDSFCLYTASLGLGSCGWVGFCRVLLFFRFDLAVCGARNVVNVLYLYLVISLNNEP